MKTKTQKKLIIALCGLLLFLASPLGYAQEATSGDDAWQFHVIPYIWMAGISGDVTVKGSRASVDGTYVKLSVDRTRIDVGSELVQYKWNWEGPIGLLSSPSGKREDACCPSRLWPEVATTTSKARSRY